MFKEEYDAANGAGAFEAMVTGVPEPKSVVLLSLGGLLLLQRLPAQHLFRRDRLVKMMGLLLDRTTRTKMVLRAVMGAGFVPDMTRRGVASPYAREPRGHAGCRRCPKQFTPTRSIFHRQTSGR